MDNRFFLPALSLAGLPASTVCHKIRTAGFDGVEVVTSGSPKRAEAYRTSAAQSNLCLHWHQPWSYEENPSWFNAVLRSMRRLPHDGYALADVMPMHRTEPMVVYADRWCEVSKLDNAWLQTCPVRNQRGQYVPAYREFLDMARVDQPPLVFDTQHILEWQFGTKGVEMLPTDQTQLEDALLGAWLRTKHLVKEIHLNDFDPSWGNTLGRNVFLGTGIAPLGAFAAAVKRSGWQGDIVLEVSPFHLFPYRLGRLRNLLQVANGLFL